MAMMIKIFDNDQKPICVYDGHKWYGNASPIILSEAAELIIFGLHHSRERSIIRNLMRKPEDESKLNKE
jgi:hypothetical protein